MQNPRTTLKMASLTAAVALAAIGTAFAAGQSQITPPTISQSTVSQPTVSSGNVPSANAPASIQGQGARSERNAPDAHHQRGEPSAEQRAAMQEALQTRISELLAQSGSHTDAAGWLRQAQALLSRNEANSEHTAISLIHAAESALGLEPQRGGQHLHGGERGEGHAHGGREEHGTRSQEQGDQAPRGQDGQHQQHGERPASQPQPKPQGSPQDAPVAPAPQQR